MAIRNEKGQFVEGVSGNPNGKPKKGLSLAEAIRSAGDEVDEDGKTKLDKVIEEIYQKALEGNTQAAELLFNRGWGKVLDRLELSGNLTMFELDWSGWEVIDEIEDDGFAQTPAPEAEMDNPASL